MPARNRRIRGEGPSRQEAPQARRGRGRYITVQPTWLLHVLVVSWEHGVMVPTQLEIPVFCQ
jgi:hypothetical protein